MSDSTLPIELVRVPAGRRALRNVEQLADSIRELGLLNPLAFRDGKALWIEAKTKSVFTWHRITGHWTTGIDLRHYTDYCALAARSPWPVWLLFLHTQAYTSEPPHSSPTGLYGNTLAYLQEHENHRSDKWANGMVYWAIDHLKQLATLTADGNLSAPNLPSRN